MPTNNVIVVALDETLRREGYARRGKTWYRQDPETISLVDLQKSNWSQKYYINVATTLRDEGTPTHPAQNKCGVRGRVTDLTPERERVERALDLTDEGLADEERCEILRRTLIEDVLPVLRSFQTKSGIRDFVASRYGPKFAVTAAAKKALGIAV
jgi:hypothetical protein